MLITEYLHGELQALDGGLLQERVAPEREEIADRVALDVSRVMERELRIVPAKDRIAVSVRGDTTATRLHAKAWLFHRESGHSTAFIGSSNLTHLAQVSGLEWNVRASGARNPAVIDKVAAVFDSYWHGGDFLPLDEAQFREHAGAAQKHGRVYLSPIALRPEPFQERMLEQLAVARSRGHHQNLLVSATGTGKTVMAAIDYARLRQALPRARLLFVAYRKEILEQALATFRHALRKPAFGELWVDGQRPADFEHVYPLYGAHLPRARHRQRGSLGGQRVGRT